MKFILPEIRGKYRFDVNLSNLCWFGVGGKASVVFIPADIDDLMHFLSHAHDIPIFVFGVGSNILIRDGGFDGVIIRLGASMSFMKQLTSTTIEVGASALDVNVSNFAMENSIGGLEFLCGIPGTIGGGLRMNAGAYGREFSDIVMSVQAVDLHGNSTTLTAEQMGFKYRGNSLKESMIFLSAVLFGSEDNVQNIMQKMNTIKNQRNATQPVKGVKTGGSTFKNPLDFKAWQLIDAAECRGLRIGGAQISELHCNFLINTGNATANDIEELIFTVKERVFKNSGIMLEEELVIIGNK